jgi:heat shock protein HslJ
VNTRLALTTAVVGLALTACSAIGARPSASADPSTAATSPTTSATPAPTSPPSAGPLPSKSPATSDEPSTGLDGREFVSVLVTVNGESTPLVTGTKIRLSFSNGMIGVSAGCNTMSGPYSLAKSGILAVDQLATTDMGCEQNLMQQDQWLANLVTAKPNLILDGNDLKLTSDKTEIDFLDREQAEPDQSLVGITWGLTTVINGDVASSIPQGVTATLLFDDKGAFTFNDGCNAGGGQYVVDGDVLHLSMVVTTTMACPGDRGSLGASVHDVLNDGDVTFSIDHTTLSLQVAQHGLQYDAAVDVN